MLSWELQPSLIQKSRHHVHWMSENFLSVLWRRDSKLTGTDSSLITAVGEASHVCLGTIIWSRNSGTRELSVRLSVNHSYDRSRTQKFSDGISPNLEESAHLSYFRKYLQWSYSRQFRRNFVQQRSKKCLWPKRQKRLSLLRSIRHLIQLQKWMLPCHK